jgi:hypothetical protein
MQLLDSTDIQYTYPPASLASVSQVLPLASGTCDLTFGGTTGDGTVAYAQTNKSTWQRFGDVVRISGVIQTNAVTATPTGNLVLRGLPFAPRTTAGAGGAGAIARSGMTSAVNTLFQLPGSTDMSFGRIDAAAAGSSISASSVLVFQLTYMI